jgi:GAF domain-containing protein
MSNFLSSLVASIDTTVEEQQATQRMLRNILIVVIVTTTLISVVDGLLSTTPTTLYALLPLAILSAVSLFLLYRQIFWPARIVIPLGALVAITYILLVGNGLHDIGISALLLISILAGLTMGRNGVVVFGFLAVLVIILVGIAEINGLIKNAYGALTVPEIAITSTIILAGTFLLRLLLTRLEQSISRLKESEQEQRNANTELLDLKESLENRVMERTIELSQRRVELETANSQIQRRASQFEALAQVIQSIISVHDLQELLPQITAVISDRFGFYHIGIFLIDEANEYAVLAAANSLGGGKMLARQHRLKVGEQGIVGAVTGGGEPRIALDVGADSVYFGSLDLPDTHSEMALPLRIGGRVIGALDIQSTDTGAFTNDDIQTLSLLADQVSLAIENARLFENSNRTLNDLQTVMRQSTHEAWKKLPDKLQLLGYRYNAMGASQLTEPVQITEESNNGNEKAKESVATSYVVPIELRGELIGNLVVQSSAGKQWNEDQKDIIKAVAERVALSAENARLFEETTRRADRERLVSEITGRIRSHNDPQSMIETAIRELSNALGASRIDIVPKSTSGKESKV